MDLNDARKKLETSLGENLKKEYFGVLRKWFLFQSSMTKEIFDQTVRKLLITNEQIRCHNDFLLAILSEANNNKPRTFRSSYDTGTFETVDFSEYVVPCSSPAEDLSSRYDFRSAAAELFVPDSGFVACRISIVAWENNLEGAESKVTDVIVNVCQTYLKNIITAMVSKLKSYKVRDKKFQYGFNMPVADPFLRNYNSLNKHNLEGNVDFEDDMLIPKCKMSLERMEQGIAHEYSAATHKKGNNTLNLKLLYETVKNNPRLLGLHSIHSVNLLKLGLILDDDLPECKLSESEEE